MLQPKKEFMEAAIKEGKKTRKKGDYAIGAVIVKDNGIISRAGNKVRINHDPTNHAEMLAIRKASKLLGKAHLTGCILYATHEPCPMCASASVFGKLRAIVYGATIKDMQNFSKRHGTKEWRWPTINISASTIVKKAGNKQIVIKGFMRKECKKLFHS